MSLEIQSLGCIRAGRLVFRGLDFTLAPGMAGVLRGPNGVGKSTLLRVLAGLLPPASGDVLLDGVRLAKNRAAFADRVAYAGHLDALKPALDVAENLAIWSALHGTGRDRVDAALERFGLTAIADRPVAQCSAGQKRRLGLARLLVTDRPLWLMDEPTVSLDTDSAALVAQLIREHVGAGGMALIATHIDLGLGKVPELRMTPPEADAGMHTTDGAHDPFLEGTW